MTIGKHLIDDMKIFSNIRLFEMSVENFDYDISVLFRRAVNRLPKEIHVLSKTKNMMPNSISLKKAKKSVNDVFKKVDILAERDSGDYSYLLFIANSYTTDLIRQYKKDCWILELQEEELCLDNLIEVFDTYELEKQVRMLLSFSKSCCRLWEDSSGSYIQIFMKSD